MALPWLDIIDTVLDLADLVRPRSRPPERASRPAQRSDETAGPGSGETRLACVVATALKEAFDRDSRRLDLERERMEMERQRAERALEMERLRQAGDREIGRLRLAAGVAVAAWLGTLLVSDRVAGGGVGARVLLGGGWLCLLIALALAFIAHARVSAALSNMDGETTARPDLPPGLAGSFAAWLIVLGLALVGLAVLTA
ncbi:MAG: hypothetical protein EXQ48_07435 [Acidobacteria bacterium]|nr:hypothetical protein [Acidobacteriota bacterium]